MFLATNENMGLCLYISRYVHIYSQSPILNVSCVQSSKNCVQCAKKLMKDWNFDLNTRIKAISCQRSCSNIEWKSLNNTYLNIIKLINVLFNFFNSILNCFISSVLKLNEKNGPNLKFVIAINTHVIFIIF